MYFCFLNCPPKISIYLFALYVSDNGTESRWKVFITIVLPYGKCIIINLLLKMYKYDPENEKKIIWKINNVDITRTWKIKSLGIKPWHLPNSVCDILPNFNNFSLLDSLVSEKIGCDGHTDRQTSEWSHNGSDAVSQLSDIRWAYENVDSLVMWHLPSFVALCYNVAEILRILLRRVISSYLPCKINIKLALLLLYDDSAHYLNIQNRLRGCVLLRHLRPLV